ncbi:MAG: aldose 1-epimerase [Thermoleophilaceae bacterium]|jgi:galactose mutarotase-like enzyme|nr:aldose 1-epimerase [Thermoleophilaceae bacterium]
MAGHEVRDVEVDGLPGIALLSHEHDLRVEFVPEAGMVGSSFTHRGEELLGQRGGLSAYRERGSSFGIPLLHPWANRLGGRQYSVLGHTVELDPDRSPIHTDRNGLPIHGILAACPHWRIVGRTPGNGRAAVAARLDFGAHEELMAAFPFPHELHVQAELAGDTLTVVTILLPTGDLAVPVAFGWHPYLQLPGVPRAQWQVELPVRQRAVLDERRLPTGDTEPVAAWLGPLGDQTYDDLFVELEQPPIFGLEGGGRRIELDLAEGYPVAQVYAPPESVEPQPFVCFEPMTAPTNALVTGAGLRSVAPGSSFRAEFRVRVQPSD